MVSPLVEALARFNRKERFWLLSDALGDPFLNLSPAFIEKIGIELGVEIPANPWWAFDYHLDWLFAVLAMGPNYDLAMPRQARNNENKGITESQEEIDLIIGFGRTIVLVEAKLTTAWSNSQMERKVKRLKTLPNNYVDLYLVMTSPGKLLKLKCVDWPDWALERTDPLLQPQPFHVPLSIKDSEHKPLMVSRCNQDNIKNREGSFWNIFDC